MNTAAHSSRPGDLKRRLMDAAIAVIAQEDPANLSLREVARALGVSHAAPKNHFADKTALLTEIAMEGFGLLGETLGDSFSSSDRTVEGLAAAGVAYVRFSVNNPGYFRVMWRNELLDQSHPGLDEAGRAAFTALTTAVEAAQSEGWAPGRQAADIAALAWASVHGMAQLHLDGPLRDMDGRNIEELTARVIGLMIEGLS
jgi:AcrR family transcriptional regulator